MFSTLSNSLYCKYCFFNTFSRFSSLPIPFTILFSSAKKESNRFFSNAIILIDRYQREEKNHFFDNECLIAMSVLYWENRFERHWRNKLFLKLIKGFHYAHLISRKRFCEDTFEFTFWKSNQMSDSFYVFVQTLRQAVILFCQKEWRSVKKSIL